MKAMAVKLDPAECERLAELAKAKDRSAHFLMREAIHQYLEREEAQQAFVAAAEASYTHYKETGMHITLDEFAAWADEVAEQPSASAPECHE